MDINIFFSQISDDPLDDKKPVETAKPDDDSADSDSADSETIPSSVASVDKVPVIQGSKGDIQWQLGTPMPDIRARACAVATDSDTIFVMGNLKLP
jgi:hypothetical protein